MGNEVQPVKEKTVKGKYLSNWSPRANQRAKARNRTQYKSHWKRAEEDRRRWEENESWIEKNG